MSPRQCKGYKTFQSVVPILEKVFYSDFFLDIVENLKVNFGLHESSQQFQKRDDQTNDVQFVGSKYTF